jgi:hypothetical protein
MTEVAAGASRVLIETRASWVVISVSFFDHPPNPKRLNQLAAVVTAVAEGVSNKIGEYGNYGASLIRRPSEAAHR